MTSGDQNHELDRPPDRRGGDPGEPRLRLRFRSEALAQPFDDRFDEPVRIDIDPIIPLPDGTHLQYWTATDISPETLREAALAFQTVDAAELVRTVEGTHELEIHGTAQSLFSTFDSFGGITHSAVYDGSGLEIVAEFPRSIDVDAVVTAVQAVYPQLDLYASQEIRTPGISHQTIRDRLTDQQRVALQLAYFGGYYEQPRRTTGDQLAAKMGITRQTFHEHLRKAYAVVFEQLFTTGTDPIHADM